MNVICNSIETKEKSPFDNQKLDWTNNDKVNKEIHTILLGNSISNSIIKAFINSMPIRDSDSDAYIECFLRGLDEKYFNLYMVDKLIQKHLGRMIPKIFYKFKFEDHDEIAEKLIKNGFIGDDIKHFLKQH